MGHIFFMKRTAKRKKIVVIGGGTGTSILLRGLREYPFHLSAIVTTADTGGSSGRLRRETGMAPPGDVRQCFVALNEDRHPFIKKFNFRFGAGTLKGHSFGNLFFAALWQEYGDLQKAIDEAERIFTSPHSVIPVTTGPTHLVAHLAGGKKLRGEAEITEIKQLNKKLKHLALLQKGSVLNPKARKAISEADYITIGPGHLFSSLTPPLLVKGLKESILASGAKKIYVANLLQKGLSDDFTLFDYLEYFEKLFGKDIFDVILYNNRKIDKKLLLRLGVRYTPLTPLNRSGLDHRFVGGDFLDRKISREDPNDLMKRNYIRHDPHKIARTIFKLQ